MKEYGHIGSQFCKRLKYKYPIINIIYINFDLIKFIKMTEFKEVQFKKHQSPIELTLFAFAERVRYIDCQLILKILL